MSMNLFRILELRYFFYIISIAYKIVLDFSYIAFINPLFSYAGFHLNFSTSNYLISWLFTILLLLITPSILNRVSDFFLVTFSFSIIVPMLCLFGFNYELSIFPVIVNLSIYLMFYVFLKTRTFKHRVKYPYVKNGEKTFQIVCLTMIAYLIIWYISSGAISNFNLDLLKVYEFRDENSELTNIGVLTYLNSWVLKVFNLALIAYALLKKKTILFFLLILVQVFFYGISAHKSVLFTPLVIYSVYFYLSRTKSIASIPLGYTILITLCLAVYFYNGNGTLGSLFIRRVFFVPNYLTFVYFEYFSNNQFAYWTNNFTFIGNPVYPDGIPSTIGSYLGSDELRANNGFISSGFAQAGNFGVFVYALLAIFILKVIDQLSDDVGALWFALCIVITPLRTMLTSSDLLTVILTHGLFIAILLLFLLRKPRLKS